MGLFGAFTDFLKGSVGNNLDNEPEDVRSTKKNLNALGFFGDETDNAFLTKELDTGIKSFQQDKGLKVDGRLLPSGETERNIFESLTKRNADDVFGNAESSTAGSVGFGGNVSGTFMPLKKPQSTKSPFVLNVKNERQETETPTPERKPNIKPEVPPIPKKKPEFDATGRMIRDDISPIPERKPEIIAPTPKGNKILDFIGKLESSDNYNVIVGGDKKPLTNMTVKEIYKLQEELIGKGKDSAVGRYQIKNSTLKETMDALGIDENEIFDEKLQDQMARSRLEFRGFEKFKAGKISTKQFIRELSKEWAALPVDESNESFYKGVGHNKALINFKILKNLLEKP